MKKLLTAALCVAAVGSMSAQKAVVDQANKLVGKNAQIGDARNLIRQAMENPETKNDVRTYYIAGKIEFEALDNATKTKMIKPDDPIASDQAMAEEAINGYRYFVMALPYDSLPNEKGKIKPKYSKEMIGKIAGHANDYFTAGATYFNDKKYPEAYEAFMIYGDLPSSGYMGKAAELMDPQMIATSYFNAGLSAYSAGMVDESAGAFRKARLNGSDQKETYIYEIACWQNIARSDSTRAQEAQDNIMEIATAGNEKFGLEEPVFLNNMINTLVMAKQYDKAISELNNLLASNPENGDLYGLRGFVFDRMNEDAKSEADYRKAAELPSTGFETLKNSAKKIFRVGTEKWNEIDPTSGDSEAVRQNIKKNYFEVAKAIVEKAATMNPTDPDLQNVMESIQYNLDTYFNN